MRVILFAAAAVTAYLVGGINPAIILSRKLYKMDLRRFGSRNPGFTNFKRILGSHNAWWVLLGDMLKSALLCALFGWLFGYFLDRFQLGAAYTMLFAMLGHAYPVWYEFKGGKSVAVFSAAIWFVDWRAGLVALFVLSALMAAFRYMSLSVLCASVAFLVSLWIFWTPSASVLVLCALAVLFLYWRHRENIVRLAHGNESKFSFRS